MTREHGYGHTPHGALTTLIHHSRRFQARYFPAGFSQFRPESTQPTIFTHSLLTRNETALDANAWKITHGHVAKPAFEGKL